jgi:hypothetical protein
MKADSEARPIDGLKLKHKDLEDRKRASLSDTWLWRLEGDQRPNKERVRITCMVSQNMNMDCSPRVENTLFLGHEGPYEVGLSQSVSAHLPMEGKRCYWLSYETTEGIFLPWINRA